MRNIIGVQGNNRQHWVGDGFPVRSLFSHASIGPAVSPFLLLDYAGPTEFPPATRPRGVGSHPHRGFETVTIVYQGEVEHRDSGGNGGVIGPGDVQWMTAGAGIMHQEFHSVPFTRAGGTLEMVQLWVNLPAASKNAKPGYQGITASQIPMLELPDGAGQARVIAGELFGVSGPTSTFTPMEVADFTIRADATVSVPLPVSHTVTLVVLEGRITVTGADGRVAGAGEAQSLHMTAGDGPVEFATSGTTRLLLLAGEPIDEPVVMHGPFVMNSYDEINQAIRDLPAGRFGEIPA